METKQIFFIILCVITGLVSLILPAFFGIAEYNYQIDKCNNLVDSNYKFTNDVQVNVGYESQCFYYNNYPYAFPLKILYYYVVWIMSSVSFLLLIYMVSMIFKDDESMGSF